jgi:hypothetical protein
VSEVLDILSTGGTLIAAWLAYVTIRQSAKASDENQRALVRERRIDFELGVLADITEQLDIIRRSSHHTFTKAPETGNTRLGTLVELLGNEELPLVRVLAALPARVIAEEDYKRIRDAASARGENPNIAVLDECRKQVGSAIRARLDERVISAPRRLRLPWRP